MQCLVNNNVKSLYFLNMLILLWIVKLLKGGEIIHLGPSERIPESSYIYFQITTAITPHHYRPHTQYKGR